MKIKGFYIPTIPVIVFFLITAYYYLPWENYFKQPLIETCATKGSSFCTQTSTVDTTSPKVSIVSPEQDTYSLSDDTVAQFYLCDAESGVDLSNLIVSIYTPGVDNDYKEYTVDDIYITYSDVEDGCTTLFVTNPEPFPPDNSVYWTVGACDCAGNYTETELYANTASSRLMHEIIDFSYYLTYLVWYIVIFGPIIFEKRWGVVYDSVTKTPLSHAVVRLYKDGVLINSCVTNENGVFHFTPTKGTYTITASKGGYTFPSKKTLEVDGAKKNLYYGGKYTQSIDGALMKISIPMDPRTSSISRTLRARVASYAVSLLTFVSDYFLIAIMIGVAILWLKPPWVQDSLLTIGASALILIVKHVILRQVRGESGKVVNEKGNPLPNVEIGLFDRTYNKIIDRKTTDKRGRYQFIVPGGLYYIKILDKRYTPVNTQDDRISIGKKAPDDILIAVKVVVRRV